MSDKVFPIENFLNIEEFSELLYKINNFTYNPDSIGWKLSGLSKSGDKKFWHINLENIDYFSSFLFEKIKIYIKKRWNEDVYYSKIYLNGQTFGQQGYHHTDDENPNSRTFLIYCNPNWNIEWGGATIFYSNGNIISVYPKPLKAVYFDGNVPHFAQTLSRDFLDLRVTLAYKLYLVE